MLFGATRAAASIESLLDPDMMYGMLALAAASASIRSAPRRNSPAPPVGEMPNGLAKVLPKIVCDWSRVETSTR